LFLSIIILNYFSGDFQKIKNKINYENELELGKHQFEFESNKCEINGNLPALAQKCKILSKKINLFKKVNLYFNYIRIQFQTYLFYLL